MNPETAPRIVLWEVTRACWLVCRHCRIAAIRQPRPGQLSTAEGLRLIEELEGFGHPPPLLALTGGDPLMRPDLFALIRRARAVGFRVSVSPAVTPFITEQTVRRLKTLGVSQVSIGLDGGRRVTHERIRPAAGNFARTLAAVDLFVRGGFDVSVSTTVMRENVAELPEIAALLLSMGVPVWEVFFLVKVEGTDVHELTPAQHEDVLHFLYDASRYGLLVRTVEAPFFRRIIAWRRPLEAGADPAERFALGSLYRRLRVGLRSRLRQPRTPPRAESVGAEDGILFVAHDGEVHPAPFLPLPLANVRYESVVDVYQSDPVLRAIRQGDISGRCGGCDFRASCGGSRGRAYAAARDPLAEDPACAYVPSPSPAAAS